MPTTGAIRTNDPPGTATSFGPMQPSLELEPHGADTFVGTSPDYPWGRIYGGLVVAQALAAATATVDPEHHVHSLHAYFILGGVPTEPLHKARDLASGSAQLVAADIDRKRRNSVLQRFMER